MGEASTVYITEGILLSIPKEYRPAFLLNLSFTELNELCKKVNTIIEPKSEDPLNWKNLCNSVALHHAVFSGDNEILFEEDIPKKTALVWRSLYTPFALGLVFDFSRKYALLLCDDDPVYKTNWWDKQSILDTSSNDILLKNSLTELKISTLKFKFEENTQKNVTVNYGPKSRIRVILFGFNHKEQKIDKQKDVTILLDTEPFFLNDEILMTNHERVSIHVPNSGIKLLLTSINNTKGSFLNLNKIFISNLKKYPLQKFMKDTKKRMTLYELLTHNRVNFSDNQFGKEDYRIKEEFSVLISRYVNTIIEYVSENNGFPIEISLPKDMIGLPNDFTEKLCQIKKMRNLSPSSHALARLNQELDDRGTTEIHRVSDQCALISNETGKRLCSHEAPFKTLKDWNEQKDSSQHPCPMCNRIGKRKKHIQDQIGIQLPDIEDEDDILHIEEELRKKYGNLFIVVKWEGENIKDVSYELYNFTEQESYEGFLFGIEKFPIFGQELENKSTAFRRGVSRAENEYKKWGKFAIVVFRSA